MELNKSKNITFNEVSRHYTGEKKVVTRLVEDVVIELGNTVAGWLLEGAELASQAKEYGGLNTAGSRLIFSLVRLLRFEDTDVITIGTEDFNRLKLWIRLIIDESVEKDRTPSMIMDMREVRIHLYEVAHPSFFREDTNKEKE